VTSTFAVSGVGQFTAGSVTTAGFALGIALLVVEHWRWYKGGGGAAAAGPGAGGGAARDPKALIPFWFGVTFGILMVACPAGLLGTGANFLRWSGNGAGGLAMNWLTGQKGTTLAAAAAPALDGYGATVVTAACLVLWWQRKQVAKVVKGKWKKGVLAGVLLCVSTGTAAVVAQAVVGGTNNLGHMALGGLVHGTLT
jgi:hypothetical protein